MFKELKETLYSTLERLYSVAKKEKGLSLNVEHAKVNSKFNLVNIIPAQKKKRNVSRVSEKYEKLKAAADIVIKDIKKLFPANLQQANADKQHYYCPSKDAQKIISCSKWFTRPIFRPTIELPNISKHAFFQVVHNGRYHWGALIS